MSSNSVRVSAALFERAQSQGELMTRSTAQQVEHWARLGEAQEALGLTLADFNDLIRRREVLLTGEGATVSELWRSKRDQQARDIAALNAGEANVGDMLWFTEEQVLSAKVIGTPY